MDRAKDDKAAYVKWNGNINIEGKDYYQARITDSTLGDPKQEILNKSIALCNQYYYLGKNIDPIDKDDILGFLTAPGELNQAWYLYSLEREACYVPSANSAACPTKPSTPTSRICLSELPKITSQCVLMLGTFQSRYDRPNTTNIVCDGLCRSPDSDAYHCAYWADKRFQLFQQQVYGRTSPIDGYEELIDSINEWEFCVSYYDVPLQLAFKRLGYYVFDSCDKTEEYYFTKIISPRLRRKKRRKSKPHPPN
jgi:hypothetical protein